MTEIYEKCGDRSFNHKLCTQLLEHCTTDPRQRRIVRISVDNASKFATELHAQYGQTEAARVQGKEIDTSNTAELLDRLATIQTYFKGRPVLCRDING